MRSSTLGLLLASGLLLSSLPVVAQGSTDAAPSAPDWLAGKLAVAFTNLTRANVSGDFQLHKVVMSGSTKTAQDLRNAYAFASSQGPSASAATIAVLQAALQDRIQSALQTFAPAARVRVGDVSINQSSLTVPSGPDPYHPPVSFAFAASIDESLASVGLATAALPLDDGKVRAAFDIGAVASITHNLTAPPGWNVTFELGFPDWVRATEASHGTLAPNGGSATWALANWRGATDLRVPATITLRGKDAQTDTPSDAHITLDVDMRDVAGLTLQGIVSGDFGKLDVRFSAQLVARNLRLADLPVLEAQVRQRLPSALTLPGVNADGLRLAVREKLLPPTALDQVAAHFQAIAAERLASFGPDNASLQGGFAPDTFSASYISSPLDGDPPLTYSATASVRIPLGGAGASAGSRMQAAAGPFIAQRSLTFDLPRVQGLETTYRITLPPGIALVGVDGKDASTERGTAGGRDVLIVTPNSDSAKATFTVAVTSEFVLSQFWYVWFGLVLVVALILAFLMLRRTRKRRARAVPPRDEPAATLPSPPATSDPEPGAPRPGGSP